MKKHLSQAELAELIDVSVVYISYIENAKRKIRLEPLVRIAYALEVGVDKLLTGNQIYDMKQYQTDIDMVLGDCTSYEKSVLVEAMRSLKNILRDNDFMFNNKI